MSNNRQAVIERAIEVLDDYGLADLTMRRLGSELGVRQSAIYHHFASKQELLAAVADELLERGFDEFRVSEDSPWPERAAAVCDVFRRSLVACSDGADVVATAYSFGLGGRRPVDELSTVLAEAGFERPVVLAGTAALVNYVFGFVIDEQTRDRATRLGVEVAEREGAVAFSDGLGLVLDGIASRR